MMWTESKDEKGGGQGCCARPNVKVDALHACYFYVPFSARPTVPVGIVGRRVGSFLHTETVGKVAQSFLLAPR